MKKIAICYFVVVLLLTGCVKRQTVKMEPGNILAVVNNKKLTGTDFLNKIKLKYLENFNKKVTEEDLLYFFDDYITLNIINCEARDKGLDKEEDYKEIIKNIEEELLYRKYEEIIEKKIPDFSKVECYQYYKDNISMFTPPDKVYIEHILVSDSEYAKTLLKEIKTGVDFNKVMTREIQSKKARGGDIGYITKGMLDEPLEKKAFGLKSGEISGVIRSKFGFHILKCYKIEKGNPIEFEQIKDEIKKDMQKEKLHQVITGLIERLKKKYNVEIYRDNLNRFIKKYQEKNNEAF